MTEPRYGAVPVQGWNTTTSLFGHTTNTGGHKYTHTLCNTGANIRFYVHMSKYFTCRWLHEVIMESANWLYLPSQLCIIICNYVFWVHG